MKDDTNMKTMRPGRLVSRSKYDIVAESVAACGQGRLLDVGSRDRILEKALKRHNARVSYVAADTRPPADLLIDLERDLAMEAESFDHVVALDVLEHVDALHAALVGLLAIAKRRCYVALPNMGALPHRLSFLRRGRLRTDKYDLMASPPPDRHRWLCVMPDIQDVLCQLMEREGFRVCEVHALSIGVRGFRHLLQIGGLARALSRGVFVDRILVVGERRA